MIFQEYPNALKYINRVLNIEPNNKQAKDLKEKIEHKMKRGKILQVFTKCLIMWQNDTRSLAATPCNNFAQKPAINLGGKIFWVDPKTNKQDLGTFQENVHVIVSNCFRTYCNVISVSRDLPYLVRAFMIFMIINTQGSGNTKLCRP